MKTFQKVFQIEVEAIPATQGDPSGFVATNEELGLVVEADSLDQLVQKINEVAPTLFELNVLPSLQGEAAEVRPAFNLSHWLGGDYGGELLPGLDCAAAG